MLEKYWIKCPICNGKTRVQVFYNTVLRNFPLFCPIILKRKDIK
ncbi:cysteine-rich KTR domain-containing protein [Collinsella aerofaciens]